jgi:hypothetical protein
MSLKQQHEELDKETRKMTADLTTVKQIRFNLKGEARKKIFLSLQNPYALLFNLTQAIAMQFRLC